MTRGAWMIRLSIAGQTVELNEHHFLTLIDNVARGYYPVARAYHSDHFNGWADWKNALPKTLEMVGWETSIETIETQIGDEELREVFHAFREHLQELIRVDEEIIEWLAGFVGLSLSEDERDRRRLGRRLDKILADQGAIWATDQEYQVFAERSQEHMLAVTEAKQRMDRRLQQLLGHSDEDGDSFPDSKLSL
jgi:hypothetical protein